MSAKASADAVINSERAWVLVEDAELKVSTSQKLSIQPFIKNFGQTTARIRRIQLGGAKPLQVGEPLPPIPIFEGA
jgi:hypothetical protein